MVTEHLYASLGIVLIGVITATTVGGGILLFVPRVRRRLVTPSIRSWFQRAVPPVSKTERIALEAGTSGFEEEFFRAVPNWARIAGKSSWPHLTEAERTFIDGPVQTLCSMLNQTEIAREQNLPQEVWEFLATEKFFGLVIPKEFGGLGFSEYAHSVIIKIIATRSIAAAVTVMVPNSLGPGQLIQRYGTPEQKSYYLPRLATGEEIPCFGLTGPTNGSDASTMPDSGVITRQGDELGVKLSFEKRYITLAPVATIIGIAFVLRDPERLLSDRVDYGITLALIPRDTPGMRVGERHDPLGTGFMNGPVRGDNVFIPISNIIGGSSGLGLGWRMLVECLGVGRAISLPSLSIGGIQLTTRGVGAYARIRQQFGLPIGKFEGVRKPLANIAGASYAMEAASRLGLGLIESGERSSVMSAILKFYLTERMRSVVNDGMDILGGAAIQEGPRNILAGVYKSLPVAITVEGANILTKNLIVFGQGVFRDHPYVLKELNAAFDVDSEGALEEFDTLLVGHVAFATRNFARLLGHSLGVRPAAPSEVRAGSQRYYRELTRVSNAFAVLTDLSLLLMGGGLKRSEMLSGRFAEVLAELFVSTAALRRFQEFPSGEFPGDEIVLRYELERSLHAAAVALLGICDNLPNRLVGAAMRLALLPILSRYQGPSDGIANQVAELVITPGAPRDSLTEWVYGGQNDDEPLRRIDRALGLVIQAEPVIAKVRAAAKRGLLDSRSSPEQAVHANVLTEDEAAILRNAERERLAVIAVDEFQSLGNSRASLYEGLFEPHTSEISR